MLEDVDEIESEVGLSQRFTRFFMHSLHFLSLELNETLIS